jgi:hypothetical protein
LSRHSQLRFNLARHDGRCRCTRKSPAGFWIRRPCPVCDAKSGQDCTTPGEPGAKTLRREHGHDERIEPIVRELEAAAKAQKARSAEDQRTERGTESLVPAYTVLKISCPVYHAKPDADARCQPDLTK